MFWPYFLWEWKQTWAMSVINCKCYYRKRAQCRNTLLVLMFRWYIWMFLLFLVSHCEENKTTNEVMAHPHFFVILSWIGIWKYSNDRKLFKTIPQRLTVRIFEVFNIYDHEIVVRWEELLTPIFLKFVGLVVRNVCIIECRNHVAEKNINTMVVT